MNLSKQNGTRQFAGVKDQRLLARLFLVSEIRKGLQGTVRLLILPMVAFFFSDGGGGDYPWAEAVHTQRAPRQDGQLQPKEAQQWLVQPPPKTP